MRVLRWLFSLLIRGPDAPWILNDLEELMARDAGRMSRGRASWRYVRNALGSAFTVWRSRPRRARGDSLVSWLDVKLGMRMLVKHPGLALVGVLGMSVAIAIGAASFAVIYTILDPALPLEEGDRVVTIQNMDATRNDAARTTHLHDLESWRSLSTLHEVGAFRTVDRNLVTPGAPIESVRTAQMTATGFRITRVSPLLGRPILEEDERAGAVDVVVIGYDVWQNRFGGDPGVIGQTLQLGAARHTVIGVMPRGFAFPINNRIWTPLRLRASDYAQWQAPAIDVFARLAPGVKQQHAQAELTTLSTQLATAYPADREHVRAQVVPYARSFLDAPELMWAFHLLQLLVSLLLVVIGTNVAVLVFARTATRTAEIAVRTALGASRARVLGQLFTEALVLSGLAAAAGLAGAHFALREVNAFIPTMDGEQLPFWWNFSLTPGVLLYVVVLAVLAALIVGVLPGLKASTRGVLAGLRHSGPGGGGMRLGRTWTFLIVSQVAVAVAILPVALHIGSAWLQYRNVDPGFNAGEFLTAAVYLDRQDAGANGMEDDGAFMQRYSTLQGELVRRLEADSRVADVLVATAVPGGEQGRPVEVEGAAVEADEGRGAAEAGTRGAAVARVAVDFFDAFGIPILAGRAFNTGDIGEDASSVIVNTSFVDRVLGGGQALGRRIRYSPDPRDPAAGEEPWYEIVGVVPGFPFPAATALAAPRVYHAVDPDLVYPVTLAVRVRGESPAVVGTRVREVGLSIDPLLRLGAVAPLSETMRSRMTPLRLGATLLMVITLSTVLLSSAGIYALMAFTVARRRREIGIRSALGAQPHRVLTGVLYRAMRQLGIGIAIGLAVAGLLDRLTGGEMLRGNAIWLLPAVALLMIVVGGIAAAGPARRGLRVHPTDALRAE
jgi:putative ABC transport system permease protein